MDEMAVEATDLVVRRAGATVLSGLDFRVPCGQVVGLLGPSGSGKTTLMRCVVGVQRITGGTVAVLGRPAGARALRRRIGYAAQTPSVYADLTVAENLAYFASLIRAPRGDPARVTAEVGLSELSHRTTGTLSGGQHTRVSLAVSLLGSPDLLVLDEPTVGLDPVLREDLWRLFHRLKERGATLLVSSHVMDEAGRCDRLVLLREGAVLAEETPEGLRARTGTHDLEQAFLRLISGRGGGGAGPHADGDRAPGRRRP